MESAPRVYLDTSAYLGVLLGEKPAQRVLALIAKKILCSSVLLLLEAERNLVRMSREGMVTPANYERAVSQLRSDHELFLLKELTVDLCLTGEFPPVQIPKSGDLLHLRTAKWFQDHGGLESFLTLDLRQRAAAQDFGLPVVIL